MIRRTVQHAFKSSTCFYLSNQHSNLTSTVFSFCPEAIYTQRYRHYVCISCVHGQMQFTRTHKCISDVHSETDPLWAIAFQACTHNYASYVCTKYAFNPRTQSRFNFPNVHFNSSQMHVDSRTEQAELPKTGSKEEASIPNALQLSEVKILHAPISWRPILVSVRSWKMYLVSLYALMFLYLRDSWFPF